MRDTPEVFFKYIFFVRSFTHYCQYDQKYIALESVVLRIFLSSRLKAFHALEM